MFCGGGVQLQGRRRRQRTYPLYTLYLRRRRPAAGMAAAPPPFLRKSKPPSLFCKSSSMRPPFFAIFPKMTDHDPVKQSSCTQTPVTASRSRGGPSTTWGTTVPAVAGGLGPVWVFWFFWKKKVSVSSGFSTHNISIFSFKKRKFLNKKKHDPANEPHFSRF